VEEETKATVARGYGIRRIRLGGYAADCVSLGALSEISLFEILLSGESVALKEHVLFHEQF